MKYMITRDENKEELFPLALWPEGTDVHLNDGMWFSDDASMVDEYSIKGFEEKYGPCPLEPGEKREIEIIVHWLEN